MSTMNFKSNVRLSGLFSLSLAVFACSDPPAEPIGSGGGAPGEASGGSGGNVVRSGGMAAAAGMGYAIDRDAGAAPSSDASVLGH